jgi:SpoVK/Ycf46/Vps4 family AAA+-type ATPase
MTAEAAPPSADPFAALMGAPAANPGQPPPFPRRPAEALALLEQLLTAPARTTVIIDYAETLLPAADLAMMGPDDRTALVTLMRWGTDPAIQAAGNFAFLIVKNLADLHPDLRAGSTGCYAVEIPLPDRTARFEFAAWYLATRPVPADLTAAQLAILTAGLSLIHIENLLLQADLAGRLTADLVRDHKRSLIEQEYAGLLEMLEPTCGFEAIGGMDKLKEWSYREAIIPACEGRLADMPQGVLLVGPPGTGKTYFVRALAKELGFNAVSLSMEKILGGIVGTSERNMARALSVVASLAPVCVFMDEIDQSDVASRGNNSGNPVAKNLFSQLLRFLSEPANRGKVIFFAASNRPDLMDDAMLRFGRMDAIIPVLLPNESERRAIAQAQAQTQGVDIADAALDLIASNTERYSAADVSAVITKARKLARTNGTEAILTVHAQHAIRTLRPNTIRTADRATLLAVQACNDLDLLPPKYAELLNDRTELARQIDATSAAEPTPRGRREL